MSDGGVNNKLSEILVRKIKVDSASIQKFFDFFEKKLQDLSLPAPDKKEFMGVLAHLRAVDVLIRLAPANIFYFDKNSEYVLINPTLEECTSDRINRESMALDKKSYEEITRHNKKVLESPGAHIFVEKDYKLDNYYISSKQRVEDDTGTVSGLVGVAIPFTETQALITSLEATNIAQASIIQTKDNFIQSIFHDVRGPLSGFYGLIELIRDKQSPEIKEEVDNLLTSMDDYALFIEQILSQPDRDKPEALNPYGLYQMLQECLGLYSATALMKQLELRLITTIKPGEFALLPVSNLKRIITNLLSNAIKFTHSGYVWLTADLVNTKSGCQLTIRVEDTGIGIVATDLKEIFTKYYRSGHKPGQYSGLGFGLYHSKKLADACQAEIMVTSDLGKGSCFTLRMPVTRPQMDLKHPEPSYVESHCHDKIEPRSILIIDDDMLALKAMKQVVGKCFKQSQITCASTYIQINRLLENIDDCNRYDLILLDLGLPGVTGLDAIKMIRKKIGYDCYIAIVSGHLNPRLEKECILGGADVAYQKPFKLARVSGLHDKFHRKRSLSVGKR